MIPKGFPPSVDAENSHVDVVPLLYIITIICSSVMAAKNSVCELSLMSFMFGDDDSIVMGMNDEFLTE